MQQTLYEYCKEHGNEKLLCEWHPSQNGALTSRDVAFGSKRKVWWLCERGHQWETAVCTRTSGGSGCPYCAGKRAYPGENDLASQYPDIASQWHPMKNGILTPDSVTIGSHRECWWQCDKGHEWQSAIASRVSGIGCPVCAGKKVLPGENDLASFYPNIAKEWHSEKNGSLKPEAVSPSSNRKVWWRCPLGHEYQSVVALRTQRGNGCPYCTGRKVLPGFNDLATVEPETAKQWHPTLNGPLTPEMVTAGSHRRVWWQCPNGHVWKAVVFSRSGLRKSGCPVCAGKAKERRTVHVGG